MQLLCITAGRKGAFLLTPVPLNSATDQDISVTRSKISRILYLGISLTLVIILSLAYFIFFQYSLYENTITIDFELSKNSDEIIYLDEVLTMSARMAVSENDARWHERYNFYQGKLDALIVANIALAPQAYEQANMRRINEANMLLVEMELTAFKLIDEDNVDEARVILYSENYENQKRIYTKAMEEILNGIEVREAARLTTIERDIMLGGGSALVGLVLILVVWVRIFQFIGRGMDFHHRVDLELRKHKQNLEELVSSRTDKLRNLNQYLKTEIKEKEKIQARLIEREKKYGSIVANIPLCIHELDREGKIVSMNPAGLTMLGMNSEEEIIGTYYIDIIDGEERQSVQKHIQNAFNGISGEFEINSLGTKKTFKSLFAPVLNELVEITKIIGISEDITERNKNLELLQKSQKMEALGTLAGGIAHDFNNILGIILANSEKLNNSAHNSDEEKRYLSRIISSSNRAADLVRQILMFSRMEHAQPVPLDLGELLVDALDMVRSIMPSFIELSIEVPKGLMNISGDPSQINQIVFNLCTNAIHAMEDTGGTLEVVLVAPSEADLGFLEMVITDNGCGMSEEVQQNIFDPFYTTKDVGKGTGLGLSVVYGIVEQLKGSMSVDSELGKGTTVRVLFPTTSEIINSISKSKESLGKKCQGHILLVDDEPELLSIYTEVLENEGYKVDACTAGEQAILKFSDQIDLVLTDYAMPDMTGVQLSYRLLDLKPNLPIILSSGYSEAIDDNLVRELGINKYLLKPVAIVDLLAAIQEALHEEVA